MYIKSKIFIKTELVNLAVWFCVLLLPLLWIKVGIQLVNTFHTNGKEDGRIDIDISPLNDRWVIQISDNGIGIKKEDLPRVFERFYRTGKSRSRNDGGAGLGLSISSDIIRSHGGTIELRKSKTGGLEVMISLPV